MDCTSSVSGPSKPKMGDSCCSGFQPGICDSPPIQSLPPVDERECQRRCRADKNCLFYSFSPQACLLQSSCPPQRSPCPGCRSGPKRPPLDKVPESCGEDTTTTGGLSIHLVRTISRSTKTSCIIFSGPTRALARISSFPSFFSSLGNLSKTF